MFHDNFYFVTLLFSMISVYSGATLHAMPKNNGASKSHLANKNTPPKNNFRIESMRPTPTSPNFPIKELRRLGIDIDKSKVSASPGKSFNAKAARLKGLVAVYNKYGKAFLRYINPHKESNLYKIQTKLFPKKRRTLRKNYTPTKNSRIKVAFFDADSTLRVARSGGVTANSAYDSVILPNVAKKLKKLSKQGYLIAIVSNQGGVAHGIISETIAESALIDTARQLSKLGVNIDYIDFAAYKNNDRKPKTGMAKRLNTKLREGYNKSIDWNRSIMVGDSGWKKTDVEPDGSQGKDFSNSDRGFAESIREKYNAPKFKYYHPREFFEWQYYNVMNFGGIDDLRAFLQSYPHMNPFKE